MYLNFKYAAEKQLSPYDIITLQTIKQMRSEKDLEPILAGLLDDDRLDFYVEKGYVTQIKGSKNDTEIGRLRLSKAGNALLNDLEIPEILEEDLIVFEWLKQAYLRDGKEVGNQKKTKELISKFRVNSGICKNNLILLCKSFMADENEWKFTNRLDYLFWKKEHMYNTTFDINSSRLYQYYLKHQEQFEKIFEDY